MDDQKNTDAENVEVKVEKLEKPETPSPEILENEPAAAKWYKTKIFGVFVFVVALLIGVGTFALLGDSSDKDYDSPTANVAEERPLNLASAIALVEGTVQYSVDGESWTDAEGGETVEVGRYVRTAASSRAVVLLDDGSAVRLDENTRIQIMTSDAAASEVMLSEGQVYSRVVPSESRVFAVVTERERFEALGTAYKTSTEADKDTLEVYQSKVNVESDDVEIEEGNKYDTEDKKKESIDLDKLKDDDFVQWNKEKDSEDNLELGVLDIDPKEDEEDDDTPAPAPSQPGAALSLSGSASEKGVALTWSNSGINATDGYKVVFDKSTTTPTYGVHSSQYVGPGNTGYTVGLEDGKTYNFRVCAYRPATGSCDSYSNTVTVKAPLVEKVKVVNGAVTLTIDDDEIEWSFTGTAPHGFKVVMSSSSGPTYPANSIQYIGPNQDSTTLPDKPDGTYYVRVCKYTADPSVDGGCTDYSNEVEYVVSE